MDIRKFIVKNIKGIGPKQASHFLRNIGYSNQIAVLDVHILRYMCIQGVISEEYKSVSNLKLYEYLELKLIKFLEFILAPIGFIDQAIWMRFFQVKATPYNTIVAAGEAVDREYYHGWLVHFDEHGCVVPGCEKIVSTKEIYEGR